MEVTVTSCRRIQLRFASFANFRTFESYWKVLIQVKFSKTIAVTSRGGLKGCETSRLPHFLGNRLTDGGEVSPTRHLPPWRFLVLIAVRGWVDPRAIVWLEWLGKLKKKIQWPHREMNPRPSACSILFKPTTLPRSPWKNVGNITVASILWT
jgi:hypothetical protein